MTLTGIIAVILLSVLLTLIFVFGLKTKGPWGSSWSFFIVVILSLSMVSLWVPPAGPTWMGAAWIDLIVTGLLVSFVMSAVTPSRYANTKQVKHDGSPDDDIYDSNAYREKKFGNQNKDIVHVGGFFWMLLLVLCLLIIIGAV